MALRKRWVTFLTCLRRRRYPKGGGGEGGRFQPWRKLWVFALTSFNTCVSFHETRSINMLSDSVLHTLENIGFSKEFYCCQHSYKKPRKVKNTTSFRCKACWVPICKATKSECCDLHIMRGLSRKRYLRKYVNWDSNAASYLNLYLNFLNI